MAKSKTNTFQLSVPRGLFQVRAQWPLRITHSQYMAICDSLDSLKVILEWSVQDEPEEVDDDGKD